MCSSNFATNPYGIKNTNIQVQKNSNQPKQVNEAIHEIQVKEIIIDNSTSPKQQYKSKTFLEEKQKQSNIPVEKKDASI